MAFIAIPELFAINKVCQDIDSARSRSFTVFCSKHVCRPTSTPYPVFIDKVIQRNIRMPRFQIIGIVQFILRFPFRIRGISIPLPLFPSSNIKHTMWTLVIAISMVCIRSHHSRFQVALNDAALCFRKCLVFNHRGVFAPRMPALYVDGLAHTTQNNLVVLRVVIPIRRQVRLGTRNQGIRCPPSHFPYLAAAHASSRSFLATASPAGAEFPLAGTSAILNGAIPDVLRTRHPHITFAFKLIVRTLRQYMGIFIKAKVPAKGHIL